MLTRLEKLVLFAIALAIRLATVLLMQPKLGVDGVGYVDSARALAQSGPAALAILPVEHSPVYSLFLAVAALIGLDVAWFAAIAQALLGAATVVVVARLTARETQSRGAGLCAGGIAAAQISFVFWTAYVISETLFLFVMAVATDRALQLSRSRAPGRDALIVGVLVLLTIGLRPTGVAFFLALAVFLILVGRSDRATYTRIVLGFGLPIVLVATLAVAFDSTRIGSWAISGVQNGLLETDQGRATSGVDLDVNPPPIVTTLPADQQPEFLNEAPLTFAVHHPEFAISQSLRKLRLFWTPILPEYSAQHALTSSLYFGAFYLLAVVGLVRVRHLTPLLTLCISSVVFFTLISVVTIVDYDQRYRLPAELLMVPLAGVGLNVLLSFAGEHQRFHRSPTVAAGANPPTTVSG